MATLGIEKSKKALCGAACPGGYVFNEPATGYREGETEGGRGREKKKKKKKKKTHKEDMSAEL